MRKLELLSPAGDMERLKMSVLYGADAVYLAGTDFGMRSFAGNFTPEELPVAVDYAHSHGVKVHVTVNTMPRNNEVVNLPAYLEQLQDAQVDAMDVEPLDSKVSDTVRIAYGNSSSLGRTGINALSANAP